MNAASRRLHGFVCACAALLFTASTLGAAPACLDPGGIGGTGATADNGGLGGTGAPAHSGGIGGTGAPADDGGIGGTGIVGTITGFASICVNGVEVHFDQQVALSENGVPASTRQLAVGQVVAVEAHPSPRGLEARRIAILHAYEGPITALEPGAASLRVMGQPVRLAAGAQVAAGLRVGEAVRVSGLRDAQGEVLASRIARAPELAQASAIGAIERNGELQGLSLSQPLPPSAEVLVRGTWNGRQLQVSDTRADPGLPFAGRVRHALVEGLVRAQRAGRIELGGFSAQLDRDTAFSGGASGELAIGQRVRVHGVFDQGRSIRAQRIELLAERPDGAVRRDSRPTEMEGEDAEQQRGGAESRSDSRTRSDSGENRERLERREESADGQVQRRERIEVRQSADRVETRERIEIFENGERVERIERIERIDKVDRPDRADKPERIERIEHGERPERVERIDRSGRSEVERVERLDHSGPH